MLKNKKTLISLIIIALLSQFNFILAREYEKFPRGTIGKSITTKLINNSKKYTVRLTTKYESTYEGIGAPGTIYPLGNKWVNPGTTLSGTTNHRAPTGKAWLEYQEEGKKSNTKVQFALPENNQQFDEGPFSITINVNLISMEYSKTKRFSPHLFWGVEMIPTYWTFYEYTITINDKQEIGT